MLDSFGHSFRRMSQRFAMKVAKVMDPSMYEHGESEYDKETFGVCHRLISKPTTTLLMSPISGKRYIKSDDDQIFIVIQPDTIKIVNHTYSYDIKATGTKLYRRIVQVFDLEVEHRREKMEAEIQKNVKHSLRSIYETLSNENS